MTRLSDVQNQVQKFWSPIFMKELRAKLLLGALVNKDYQGDLKKQGDTVYVSQVVAPTGQLLTTGTDNNSFAASALTTQRVAITANKRAVAAFEFEDLVDIQSQLEAENSEIREALLYACMEQVNTYLYSLVAPSSSPDHTVTGVTDLTAAHLSAARTAAATAKWMKEKGWWGLLSPQYYGDLLDEQTMTSKDYVDGEAPVVGGQIVNKRFGFNLLEDDSRSGDYGLFFHPDFLHLVMQKEPQFKISDLHSNKQFGYVISVDAIFGAGLGIGGDVKHYTITS